MGRTGVGKTAALAHAFQDYDILLTGQANLEGFESIMEDLGDNLRVPRHFFIGKETKSGRPTPFYSWFVDHKKRVRAIMQKRATSRDPKVRRTLAGTLAKGWVIPENEPTPGIVVSEFSTLLQGVQGHCDTKFKDDSGYGRNFRRVQDQVLAYRQMMEHYHLGWILEMHIAEESTSMQGATYPRGPLTPSGPFRDGLARDVRFCWELHATYDYDTEEQERYVMTRSSEDTPTRKSRFNVPAKLDLTEKTLREWIIDAGIPVD